MTPQVRNRTTMANARDELHARIAPLEQQRAELLSATAATAIEWRPSDYAGEEIGRRASIAQTAVRLAAIDTELAAAQAAVDAADELLSAFDTILNPDPE